MFDIDPKTIRRGPWLIFIFIFFVALMPLIALSYWCVYWAVVFMSLVGTVYFVYFCERYTIYISSVLFSVLGGLIFMCSSYAYLVASGNWGANGIEAAVIGLSPLLILLSTYLFISNTSAPVFVFDCVGSRVNLPRKTDSWVDYRIGFFAGLQVFLANIFIEVAGEMVVVITSVLGLTLGCLWILIYHRNVIRGLRILRLRERTMPAPYTFMQIEEIREARSRWLLGRVLKWIASCCKSLFRR